MEDNLLKLKPRRDIYELVKAHPGLHLREISRRCGLPLGTALYHLDQLEAHELVKPRPDKRYKRYFAPNEAMGWKEKNIMCFLRRPTPFRIIKLLLEENRATQKEIGDLIGVSRSTVSFHLEKLVSKGIVQKDGQGVQKHYSLVHPEVVRSAIKLT